MAYCTASQVRASNTKLSSSDDISDAEIEDRIAEADATIIVDLSGMLTEAEITSLGATNKVINLLSRWKSVELSLSYLYGAARQADQVSDVDYWRKKYDNLLARIISGEIILSATESAVNTPQITPATYRKKLFPRKGIPDFEEGYVDDEF